MYHAGAIRELFRSLFAETRIRYSARLLFEKNLKHLNGRLIKIIKERTSLIICLIAE